MTAAQLELITAAVDGELSAVEQRAFRALLASSPEAQKLFAQLGVDRDRLSSLPKAAPPADLQAKIMAKVATLTPAPRAKVKPLAEPSRKPAYTPLPVERSSRPWMSVAVAASVLLCVSVGSFAFFRNGGSQHTIAKNNWANVLPAAQSTSPAVPSPVAGPFERPNPHAVVRIDVSPVPPVPTPREVPLVAVVTAPAPRTVTPDLIGFPVLPKLPPFERIEVRVPFLRPVADLGREDVSQELLDAIGNDQAPIRFDLFVRDTARGVEVFQNAAKVSGVAVHADAAMLEKLKRKQMYSVAIYTETLSAKELAVLFAQLSTEDAKFSPRVGDSLHTVAAVRSDELELKAVLGHDVGLYKRPAGSGQNTGAGQGSLSHGKSVSADTIDRVVQSVSGSPGAPVSPSAKALDKPAVLVQWPLAHPGATRPNLTPTAAQAADIKQHLRKGGDRKPNAVPAIIVIRPAG